MSQNGSERKSALSQARSLTEARTTGKQKWGPILYGTTPKRRKKSASMASVSQRPRS